MTKKQIAEQERTLAIARLRKCCPPGTTIHISLVSVSRSGMYRRMRFFVGDFEDITRDVARATSSRLHLDNSLGVGGCGMDMGFAVVYDLSYALYPKGFNCVGSGKCFSNDHSNGDRNYDPDHHHGCGGYALRHRWM